MHFDWKNAYERLVSKVMDCLDLLEESVSNGEIPSKAVHQIIKKLIQDEQNRTLELAKSQLQMDFGPQSKSKYYSPAQNQKAKNLKHGTVNKEQKSKYLKETEIFNAVSLPENEIEMIDLENDIKKIENTNDAESQSKETALNFQIEKTDAETIRNVQSPESETSGISDISLNSNPNQRGHQDEHEDGQAKNDSLKKTNSNKKPFNCPKCPFRAKWKIIVKLHFKSAHLLQSPTESGFSRPFPCPESGCTYAAKRKNRLNAHSKIHRAKKSFICSHPNCNYSTKYKSNLVSHTRVHTGQKPFVCQFESCSYAAAQRSHLVRHTRSHTKERPFKCPEANCEYSATQKSDLKKHRLTHHLKEGEELPTFKCPLCEYSTKSKNNLPRHIKSHTLEKHFKCDEPNCNHEARTKNDLKSHKLRHSDEKPFSCSVESCKFSCKTKGILSTHLKTVHSDERQYKCELCPFRGKTRKAVTRHIQNVHFDIRPFKCTERKCNSAFKTKAKLKHHLETHKREQE